MKWSFYNFSFEHWQNPKNSHFGDKIGYSIITWVLTNTVNKSVNYAQGDLAYCLTVIRITTNIFGTWCNFSMHSCTYFVHNRFVLMKCILELNLMAVSSKKNYVSVHIETETVILF